MVVEESMHIVFDEANPFKRNDNDDFDISENDVDKIDNSASSILPLLEPPKADGRSDLPMDWKTVPNHPIDQILGDPSQGVATRSSLKK